MAIQEPHDKTFLTSSAGRFVDSRTYGDILLFACSVIVAAAEYFWLAPSGHGLISGQSGKRIETLGDSLYFSVVTFTTVGYGDLLPVGFGRIISALLALFGLASAALLIGKVASERQYSMLLLLHTSDCQRRITEFTREVQAASSHLRQAALECDMHKLDAYSKDATGLISAVSKYVVFHLNQSRLADFGNYTSLRFLCSEARNLQLDCSNVFKLSSASSATCQRCLVLVERLTTMVQLISNYEEATKRAKSPGAPGSGANFPYLGQMTLEVDLLKAWSRSRVTEWSIKRVFDAAPKRPVSRWAPNEHKLIAAQAQLSNNLTRKCVDVLIQRGLLSIH